MKLQECILAWNVLILLGMSRPIRHFEPNCVVEITDRTVQSRFLLKPSADTNEIILGVLGRALTMYTVTLHAFVFMSNHYHFIATVPDVRVMARFMNFVNSNIAREIGRSIKWREKFWGRRYRPIEILGEEAQVERLTYLLSHGCKEGLIPSPKLWPGVTCLPALMEDEVLKGTWFDRTAEYKARLRGEKFSKYDYATEYEVPISPLPCWADVPEDELRSKIQSLITEIEATTKEILPGRRSKGFVDRCISRILGQDSHASPQKTKKGPAPLCHATNSADVKAYKETYNLFIALYREASALLRRGFTDVEFPQNCFPPALSYVGVTAI
jgi:REP element-mobilizing transposase RayT